MVGKDWLIDFVKGVTGTYLKTKKKLKWTICGNKISYQKLNLIQKYTGL